MRIGLIDIEPKIVNTAMMQVSQYHKQKGDSVEWVTASKINTYDKLYASSLFDFTDKSWIPKRTICGGTGFDIKSQLPEEIDQCEYDYSIYPACDYSIVWLSRGCIRKCPFCLVWKKEGMIHPKTPKELNNSGKYIKIQDNNFFANPEWPVSYLWLKNNKLPVEFSSGIDVRIIDKKQCMAINKLKIHGQIHIAWDNPKDDLIPQLKLMLKYIKAYKIMCYVLIGYWSTPDQDLYRIETLRGLGIDPFVMPYDKNDLYQKRFARWCNHKAIFKKVDWKNYKYQRVQSEKDKMGLFPEEKNEGFSGM